VVVRQVTLALSQLPAGGRATVLTAGNSLTGAGLNPRTWHEHLVAGLRVQPAAAADDHEEPRNARRTPHQILES